MQKNVNNGDSEMEKARQIEAIAVLELVVNNHPGVMSHICGLFSRRAYNVEGIICIPMQDGMTSKMWLQVNEENKLEQIIKQVKKLPDVLTIERHDGGHRVFERVGALV
jgi:acetolactate synthase-1/3 small subunit